MEISFVISFFIFIHCNSVVHGKKELLSLPSGTHKATQCSDDQFPKPPTCQKEQIIYLTSALVKHQLGEPCNFTSDANYPNGCQNDVLKLVSKYCSAKSSCNEIDIFDREFREHNANMCKSTDLQLDIEYTCVEEVKLDTSNCEITSDGFFTEKMTRSNCNGEYKIHNNIGGRIQLILHNFNVVAGQNSNCVGIGQVWEENGFNQKKDVCYDESERVVKFYTSASNQMHITLTDRFSNELLLEVKYICYKPVTPEGATLEEISGLEAVIKCDSNNIQWKLECTDYEWKGEQGNCAQSQDSALGMNGNFSMLWVVVAVAVCVLVVITVVVVGVVLVYRHRYRMEEKSNQPPAIELQESSPAALPAPGALPASGALPAISVQAPAPDGNLQRQVHSLHPPGYGSNMYPPRDLPQNPGTSLQDPTLPPPPRQSVLDQYSVPEKLRRSMVKSELEESLPPFPTPGGTGTGPPDNDDPTYYGIDVL